MTSTPQISGWQDGSEPDKDAGLRCGSSYSPDGEWVAFASNRHAYTDTLDKKRKARFEIDKSFLMEIYRMRADGSEVQRLTEVNGYDGGPFFSAEWSKICWRRFNEGGDQAEIWTMNADGSDQKQITKLGARSWAPFFHPSGEYLIFCDQTCTALEIRTLPGRCRRPTEAGASDAYGWL